MVLWCADGKWRWDASWLSIAWRRFLFQQLFFRGNHVSSTIMSRLYFLHYQKKDLFAGNVVNNLILRNNLILLIRKLDILNPSFEKGKAARRPPVLKTGRRAPAHNGTAVSPGHGLLTWLRLVSNAIRQGITLWSVESLRKVSSQRKETKKIIKWNLPKQRGSH